MRRLPFLPVFFITLAVAFGIALAMRLRAHAEVEQRTESVAATTTNASTQPADRETIAPADTGVIIDATPSGQPETPAQRISREQRYRELLQTPPANATVVPTNTATMVTHPPVSAPPRTRVEAKPSLMQRIVAPIVNALGGGHDTPQMSSQPQRDRASRDTTPKETRDPDDPTSDTQPPRVLSIEFIPPEVHDGEETLLVVTAVDELSGVRNISGSVSSPSGALQGFACQREGETNRYSTRIAIPKDAAEGAWRVNYLTLTDNASNSVNLSYAQGTLPPTAAFKVVSSRPDSNGPALKAIWLDKVSMRAGEHNKLFVQADDDKSGVTLVSGVFLSPAKHARIGFGCRSGSNGAWECEIAPPQCLDCGSWQLEQIQLQDKANNMTTMRTDNALVASVKLDISSDQCDSVQPALNALVLDQGSVSNVEVSTITVTSTVTDDTCGVASVSGQAIGPSGTGAQPRIYFSFSPAGDSNTWIGRITIPKLAAKGVWSISWIQVLDKGHNLKTYSPSDAVLSGATFRVQ